VKTIITLDSWQIKSFLTCEESYKLAFIENLKPIRFWKDEHRYTDKGTLVHHMLATFYTMRALNPKVDRLTHGTATINLFKKNKLILNSGFDKEFESFIISRFQQYLFKYMTGDWIPTYRNGVVGVETPFAFKLYEDSERIFILEGRIDLLATDARGPFFCDHKTQGRISNLYARKIQFLCYALATGYEYGLINYFGLQKEYKEGETLRQKLIHIPKSVTEAFKKYLIEEVYMEIVASGTSAFRKNLNSCSGPDEKRPCQFAMICENSDSKERQSLIKQQFYETGTHWSPWNDAVIGMEENDETED
jgi:hypothetical protein